MIAQAALMHGSSAFIFLQSAPQAMYQLTEDSLSKPIFVGGRVSRAGKSVWNLTDPGWGGQATAEGVTRGLKEHIRAALLLVQDAEEVGVGARGKVVALATERAVKLVEDAVILVQIAELHPQPAGCQWNP